MTVKGGNENGVQSEEVIQTSQGEAGGTVSKGGESVGREEFQKVLNDLHKHKSEARTLREQIEADKLNKQKEQNQWREIAEAKEKESLEYKTRAEKIQESYLGERKYNSVRSACEKMGLRPEAVGDLDMLDLKDVQVETTSTGKINILGSDKFAERLKTLKPHWFSAPSTTHVNTSGNRVHDSSGPVSVSQVMEAEREGRKTGNMSKYNDLHSKFQQQRLAGKR